MSFLNSIATKLTLAAVIGFSASHAQAALIRIDFEGTISSVTNSTFSPLISVGDAVSATVFFNVSPPDAFNALSDSIDPGDSLVVDGGSVSGFILGTAISGCALGSCFVGYDFRGGNGPSAADGNDTLDIDGIYIRMTGITGATAALPDYIALPSSAFSATLIGERTSTGFSSSGPVADIAIRSASYRLASAVPEPTTLALLGLGLAGFAASRRRKQ